MFAPVIAEKKPRNVTRDTPCPKCGKLFVKNAVRMHEPWCKGKTNKAGADSTATSAPNTKRESELRQSAPAAAPASSPSPKPTGSWFA